MCKEKKLGKPFFMKNISINLNVKLLKEEELLGNEKILIEKAIKATENSYAPYSKFCVGACLELEDGTHVLGANQENAAYSVTLCAERSAIFAAQSNYPQIPITKIAIAARNLDGLTKMPISPCGSCRQVLLEMQNRYGNKIKVYLYGTSGIYLLDDASELLPLSFSEDSMR